MTLSFSNRQRKLPLDLSRLEKIAQLALPAILASPGTDEALLLNTLEVIEITILSSREMGRVHRQFLDKTGPTDVITFPYGEILVCAEVAAEQAPLHDADFSDELALYVIHGLLHLHGYDDCSPRSAQRMADRQANVLNYALDQL